MLVNPYREPARLATLPGTRVLVDTLGVIGMHILDPLDARRLWEIRSVYAPCPGRKLGGIRVKLMDQKGFVTFCNQRDLEVLLDIAKPGDWCGWLGADYFGPGDDEWFGLCCDDEDLQDDLQEREFFLRGQLPGGILSGLLSLERRVHLEYGLDVEDVFVLIRDYDPETGYYPDLRFETIEGRWSRSERRRVRWDRV